MPVLLALDAGTGGAKCAIFDVDGHQRAVHREAWTYTVRPHPDFPAIKEYGFDPQQFWAILCRCGRQALARAGVPPRDVLGVATTSQREGCVFLGPDGQEVYAGPNLDSRGFMEGLDILTRLGPQRLYEITGHSAPFIFAIARYLWFRKHDTRPVARVLMINDWMTYRLCGAIVAEPSNAAESMFFDLRQRTWSAELLEMFDIPAAVLPPLCEPGQRIGAVSAETAAATGLLPGTPVYAGGADTQCSLLGSGAIEPGDTAAILGTTCPVQAVVERPTLDPRANLWAGCHVVPNRWVIEANVGACGDAYHWLLDLMIHEPGDRHARAEALARPEFDSGTFLFIGSRIFDLTKIRPDMPGGILFRFPSLQLRPGPGELLRGFFESLGFAIRANVAQIEEVTRAPAPHLIAGGGMTRNQLLLQILADITGLDVWKAEEAECTGLGCAILVATGAGLYPDFSTAVRAMCRHSEIAPRAARHEYYNGAFAKWRELYDALDQLSV